MFLNWWIYIYFWIYLVKLISTNSNNEMTPIIGIEMVNNGFHRDLSYVVHFDYPMAGKDCDYFLEQKIPAAVYVNVDQLNDLVRLKKLKARYPSHIDVEAPTEKSKPFEILLWGTPKITDNINLPIHFRYHLPSNNKKFIRVEIDIPNMYIKCPDSEGVTLPDDTKNTSFCIENTTLKLISSPLSSSLLHSENCDWRLLKYDLHLKNNLIANIPVGDSNLYEYVLYLTILVSWIGCICILFTVHSKMETLKKKI